MVLSGAAAAQTFVLGGKVQFSPDQKLMFGAAKKVMNRDYKGAETVYDQVIAMNGGNIDAYIQRGTVRRELGDAAGTASDGNTAVTLANAALKNTPNNPMLYYQRGMGFRLLKNYDQAEKDVAYGIRLGGQPSWKTDIQAIELEKKEAGLR